MSVVFCTSCYVFIKFSEFEKKQKKKQQKTFFFSLSFVLPLVTVQKFICSACARSN